MSQASFRRKTATSTASTRLIFVEDTANRLEQIEGHLVELSWTVGHGDSWPAGRAGQACSFFQIVPRKQLKVWQVVDERTGCAAERSLRFHRVRHRAAGREVATAGGGGSLHLRRTDLVEPPLLGCSAEPNGFDKLIGERTKPSASQRLSLQ